MKLTCSLVDDEPLALQLLETYVIRTPFLSLQGKYSSAVKAMDGLKERPVDLLFLDIQMPDLSGIEFSRMVDKQTRIIFTTAFSQYALDGFKVNALDYLLKPISYADFLQAVKKALEWYEMKQKSEQTLSIEQPKQSDEFIYVKSDYKLLQIPLKRILYIEGLKDYVKIHLEGETRSILSMITLRSLEEKLPSSLFIRVHRSFIVQKERIKIIDHNRIVFGKEYIPISDSYKEVLNQYLESKTIC